MTFPDLAAPLAAALAAKGYETLTPVQQAVLAPELAGRDLLVSAQTGSGKTVAFGLAVAPELLSGDLTVAVAPRALVVAPTRELALQVRAELEWLYGPAGAQIASCVGGMDWRTERRALERGAAIVVGTPGRLRDHIQRGSLDLTDIRAVVLDEADEMLDLGFQEDLEFILGAAPTTRRTLMFSATVPDAIATLATTYQQDAARVTVAGAESQHRDIAYQAVQVAARDKENGIINLLLLRAPRVAIVFAKTRAAVTHLHTRMANRGFRVVALSGELSQTERSHALQALRDGRAQVCIATDVAARGIDLPGLDLVVHFDLPTNPETLLHRSGRTGRAGAKGTAVLVVTPADARRAQRVLGAAQITAEWITAPSYDEVQAADDARLLAADALLDPVTEDEAELAAAILAAAGPDRTAAAVLRLWRAGRSAPEVVGDLPASAPPPPPAPRARTEFGPAVWYALSVGHEGRAEARWLLPKICDGARITRNEIGAIRVQQRETFIQIAEAAASGLPETIELDNGIIATRLATAPDLSRPPPRSGGPRHEAGAGRPWTRRDDGGERPQRRPRDEERSPRPWQPRPDRPAARPAGDDGPLRKPRWGAAERADAGRTGTDRGDSRKPGTGKPWPRRDDAGAGPARPPRPQPERSHGGSGAAGAGGRKPRESGAYGDERPARPYGAKPGAGKPEPGKPGSARPYAAKPGGAKPFGTGRPGGAKPFGAKPRPGPGPDARPMRPAAPPPNMADPGQSLRGKPRRPGPGGPKGYPKGGPKRG